MSEQSRRKTAQTAAARPVPSGQQPRRPGTTRTSPGPGRTFLGSGDAQFAEALTTVQQVIRTLRHARSDARLTVWETERRGRMPHNTLLAMQAGMRWPTLPVLLRVASVLKAGLRAEDL